MHVYMSLKHECQTITRPHHKATSNMISLKSQHTLTHWGRVTHICVVNLTIIGSDNGLSPGRHQAIIWTNAWILLTGPLATNFIEILIGIQTFLFKKMHLKMSSAKWRPFCLGLNVLTYNSTRVSNVSSSCKTNLSASWHTCARMHCVFFSPNNWSWSIISIFL